MRDNSPLLFVLKSFIPYTRQNMMLTFKPSSFFRELERVSHHKRRILEQSYYHAKRMGYLTNDPVPRLTAEGRQKLVPFTTTKLDKEAKLMIIFDIPEHSSLLRKRLRRLLKNLTFKQIQKSVWVTDFDHREILREAVRDMELLDYVQIYECAKLPVE